MLSNRFNHLYYQAIQLEEDGTYLVNGYVTDALQGVKELLPIYLIIQVMVNRLIVHILCSQFYGLFIWWSRRGGYLTKLSLVEKENYLTLGDLSFCCLCSAAVIDLFFNIYFLCLLQAQKKRDHVVSLIYSQSLCLCSFGNCEVRSLVLVDRRWGFHAWPSYL